ncbi:hypothetical protein D9611_007748 [Ephemerocybe angulata]|uniref:Ubiquitin-like-conjugating enzyme ATG10 n=1 Tax=Ephemerocybe angulata TaxID=980116 RepID=A0A8H5FCF6_9AGAR|nr:hypothetical protein D9611_007748 [Tulosesus angulatus]
MLTRSQFAAASRALVAKHESNPPFSTLLRDWEWIDAFPYGYLARSKRYIRNSLSQSSADSSQLGDDPGLQDEEDSATAHTTSEAECVISQQFVVFSATFQVPAFYFTAHKANGTTLSLDEIMNTKLFKFEIPIGSDANGFALTLPDVPFPLLSQGDHPTLGTPCWYLHPCETSNAVDELFREVMEADWDEETRLVRWLETWFMTVGGVLDL